MFWDSNAKKMQLLTRYSGKFTFLLKKGLCKRFDSLGLKKHMLALYESFRMKPYAGSTREQDTGHETENVRLKT